MTTSDKRIQFVGPRHGVVTLSGYGIKVRVNRGHLIFEDGIGSARRQGRFPRVAHGLRRLVVIGADGMVSLAAFRWLADQDAAFVMLDRNGSVLAATGPVRPSDARLRRAQALAQESGAALEITRHLINQKLAGQEQVARKRLLDCETADKIFQLRAAVATTETIQAIRSLEAQAAAAYWSAWRDLPIMFPKNDLPRVPEHWRTFGTRKSPLSGSPRLAVNPPNAMLNYLYALAEAEARLAAAALGLDPGLGFLHVDSPSRDSLAADLMEAIRPHVDAYVLDWTTHELLSRKWFFEQRDGNCRLMGSFAIRLSETAPTWARAVAPFAEWIVGTLWLNIRKSPGETSPATRLTQRHRREAKGALPLPPPERMPRRGNICRDCGTSINDGSIHCRKCVLTYAKQHLVNGARSGRLAAHTAKADASRAATQRQHFLARRNWKPSDQPAWLNAEAYAKEIQPHLLGVTNTAITEALGVTKYYAIQIRHGRRRPHLRHWQALAKLVGFHDSGV